MKKAITHTYNDDGTATVNAFVRVLLYRDGRHFIAQSLEVDYCSAGLTLEEAKESFARGFTETIKVHLAVYGSAEKMLKRQAPPEFFSAYYGEQMSQDAEPLELPVSHAAGVPRWLQFMQGGGMRHCEAATG